MGAEGELLDNCVLYGRIILAALPAFILQYEFQSFFVTAQKPQLGLAVTMAAGIANMVLDALFVALFQWGLVGAAAATATGAAADTPKVSSMSFTSSEASSRDISFRASRISSRVTAMLVSFQKRRASAQLFSLFMRRISRRSRRG